MREPDNIPEMSTKDLKEREESREPESFKSNLLEKVGREKEIQKKKYSK